MNPWHQKKIKSTTRNQTGSTSSPIRKRSIPNKAAKRPAKTSRRKVVKKERPPIKYAYPPRAARSKFSWKWFLFKLFLLGAVCSALFATATVWWYGRDLPSIAMIEAGSAAIAQSTKIFDRTGEHLLYTLHGEENRTKIDFNEIPSFIKEATISVEDKNFYSRKLSVDLKGVLRAVFGVLKNRDLSGPGGSTITQQLVKNLILTREKVLSRKLKEIILAYRLEKHFSRDKILDLYLNQIPYGSNAYGIQSAAYTFFKKDARELSLAEAALLAGLPKATTFYSPYGDNLDQLFNRQKSILRKMLDQGYIGEDQYQTAKNEPLLFNKQAEKFEAPHFVVYVKELLATKFGETELEQGGLKVITTLDWDLQQLAEQAVSEGVAINIEKYNSQNAALTAIDPKTGQILAMVGSRDYFDPEYDGQVNVVTRPRQPGSSIKPIIYLAGFRQGYTPETLIYDVETDFTVHGKDPYTPKNYDESQVGPLSIRDSLASSKNIAAVKMLYLTGMNNVLDLSSSLGYTTLTDPDRYGLSLALGGGEVTLLEHTQAFAVLANQGQRYKHTPLLRVEDNLGNLIYEYDQTATEIIDPQFSNQITDILADDAARERAFGPTPQLTLGPDRPVAVKTGTTQNFRDAWTMGYTPQISVGVWAGNNDNSQMSGLAYGSRVAAPIWHQFIKAALTDQEIELFNKPKETNPSKPILKGEIPASTTLVIDKASGKLATELTPETFKVPTIFKDHHNILHYVTKRDPQGKEPTKPESDLQYKAWEEAIINWSTDPELQAKLNPDSDQENTSEPDHDDKPNPFQNNQLSETPVMVLGTPPTEEDDLHTLENKPQIKITDPEEKEKIQDYLFFVDVDTDAPRGISRVVYYLNDTLVQEVGRSPYSGQINLGGKSAGLYTIKAVAYDDIDNQGVDTITIEYQTKIEN